MDFSIAKEVYLEGFCSERVVIFGGQSKKTNSQEDVHIMGHYFVKQLLVHANLLSE